MMPAISSRNGKGRAVGETLDRTLEGRKVDGKARQNLAALGAREISRRQVLDVLEQLYPDIRDQRSRQLGVPSLVPDRDDRGEHSRDRQHRENFDEGLEILLAERVVDQEFQAERHDDIEQRLDHDAEPDECQYFLVVLQERFDEGVDRRQRAGGFLGGEDDEVLVLFVIVEIKLVIILFVFIVVIGRGRERLVADNVIREMSSAASFLSISGATGSPAEARSCLSGDGGLDAMKPTMLHGRHDRKMEANALCDQNAVGKANPDRRCVRRCGISRRLRPCRRTSNANCRSRHTSAPAPCWRPASPPTTHPCNRGGASTNRTRCRRTIPTIPTRCRVS